MLPPSLPRTQALGGRLWQTHGLHPVKPLRAWLGHAGFFTLLNLLLLSKFSNLLTPKTRLRPGPAQRGQCISGQAPEGCTPQGWQENSKRGASAPSRVKETCVLLWRLGAGLGLLPLCPVGLKQVSQSLQSTSSHLGCECSIISNSILVLKKKFIDNQPGPTA